MAPNAMTSKGTSSRSQPFRLIDLGEVYRQLGLYEEAATAYRCLLEFGMTEVTLFPCANCTHRAVTLAHEGQGRVFAALGHWHEAASEFEQALRLEPRNPALQFQLGWATYRDTRQAESPIAHLVESARLDPLSPWPEYRLGCVYREEGEHELALQAYARAIELDPLHSGAHYQLGTLLRIMGDVDNAAVELAAAVRLNPENQTYRAALCDAYIELGWEDAITAACAPGATPVE